MKPMLHRVVEIGAVGVLEEAGLAAGSRPARSSRSRCSARAGRDWARPCPPWSRRRRASRPASRSRAGARGGPGSRHNRLDSWGCRRRWSCRAGPGDGRARAARPGTAGRRGRAPAPAGGSRRPAPSADADRPVEQRDAVPALEIGGVGQDQVGVGDHLGEVGVGIDDARDPVLAGRRVAWRSASRSCRRCSWPSSRPCSPCT